ncbi:MAG: extracellular solute-binding protein [Clostridia bacterium]|nr:extracellular solute-binding protein [Clostridia bacterium]
MKKKRTTASKLLTALILAGISLLSCGDQTNPNKPSTSGEAQDTSTNTSDSPYDFEYPTFDGLDFGGEDFVIYRWEWGMYREYFEADTQSGDVLNEALWRREQKVYNLLNVNIRYENPDGTNHNLPNRISTQVLNDDHTYDLFLTHCCMNLDQITAEGYLYNFNDLPHIDMTQPYWNQNFQETLSIDGYLPLAFSDYLIPDPDVIFFHKQLLADNDLESPYDLVHNGTWTWDKLIEMAKEVKHDLNGDGVWDMEDQYGFMAELDWQFNGILQSIGDYVVTRDNDGTPIYNPLSDRVVDICKKLDDFLFTTNAAYTWEWQSDYDVNNGYEPPVSFKDGRALFFMVPMNTASDYRGTNVNFGILPFPKYDEAQEDYLSLNWSGLMAVPSNTETQDMTGAVLELLSAEGRATVLPVYYDMILESKISRDEESAKMLDIIFENTVFDFGMTYQVSGELFYLIPRALANKHLTAVTYYEQHIRRANNALEDFLESIENVIANQ